MIEVILINTYIPTNNVPIINNTKKVKQKFRRPRRCATVALAEAAFVWVRLLSKAASVPSSNVPLSFTFASIASVFVFIAAARSANSSVRASWTRPWVFNFDFAAADKAIGLSAGGGAIVVLPSLFAVGVGLGTVTAATGGLGRIDGFAAVSFDVFGAEGAAPAAPPAGGEEDRSGARRRQRSDTSALFNKLDKDPIRFL